MAKVSGTHCYLAIAAALSSTVIIVKLLYDKQELDTLTGRITLGVLVLQDLAAILFLAVQPNLENLAPAVVLGSLARVVVLVAVTLMVSRYILPAVFRRVSRTPELVQVGALAWCFMIGEFGEQTASLARNGSACGRRGALHIPLCARCYCQGHESAGFLRDALFCRARDANADAYGSLITWALIFAAFVVVSRVVTTFTPLYKMGQGLRTSIIPPINLSQVSEFSLVVLSLGAQSGHLRARSDEGDGSPCVYAARSSLHFWNDALRWNRTQTYHQA